MLILDPVRPPCKPRRPPSLASHTLIYMNMHMNLWLHTLTQLLTLTARITKDPGLAARLWEAAEDLQPR